METLCREIKLVFNVIYFKEIFFTVLMNIESPSYPQEKKKKENLEFSKIHLSSYRVTSDNHGLHSYLPRTKRKS